MRTVFPTHPLRLCGANRAGAWVRIAWTLAAWGAWGACTAGLVSCDRAGAGNANDSSGGVTNGAVSDPAAAAESYRVVALSPAVATIVRDLGYTRSLVGRHAYDLSSDTALPVCGDQNGVDYEALLRVRPTHIITEWGSRTLPDRLLTLSASEHWRVQDVRLNSLSDIASAVEIIDRAFAQGPGGQHDGTQDAGTQTSDTQTAGSQTSGAHTAAPLNPRAPLPTLSGQAVELSTKLRALAGAAGAAGGTQADSTGKPRVVLLVSASPLGALGPGSTHDEVLRGVGGASALTQVDAFVELTLEELVALNADAIVLLEPRDARVSGSQARAASESPTADRFQALRGRGVRAVEAERTLLIDDAECLLPGTSMLRLADVLRPRVAQWAGEVAHEENSRGAK